MRNKSIDGPFSGCTAVGCLPGDLITCDTTGQWAIIVSNEVIESSNNQRIVRIRALFYNGVFTILPNKRVTVHKGVVR
jgi:hypothetical protein